MITTTQLFKNLGKVTLAMVAAFTFTACSEDDDMMDDDPMTMSYNYDFSGSYSGTHPNDFSAMMEVEEIDNSSCKITITLMNTLDGEMYMIHAHDAADPNNTPNGTPYNETPNADVLVQMATGNGGTVSVSQTANMSYEEITSSYEAFFVVHDPTQQISTTDLTTYLVVGAFAR
ncbi:MAG: hypothetical protein HWE14_09125 [Flavobacteriia bacterium]|nr:hypothetical protein [Flavobacteriia bacterium]